MPECGRNTRAPVSPLGDPSLVAKPLHQQTPCGGDAGEVPSGLSWLVRKSKSRKRRNDYMKRILCATAILCRARKGKNDVHEFHDRSRPAMGQNDWQSIEMRRAYVDEMNAQSIDGCPKVWKRVQLCLEASPVITRFPILDERFCEGEGNSLRPVLDWLLVVKSRSLQACPKIVNGFLWDRNMK